jgi:hypothetical protein
LYEDASRVEDGGGENYHMSAKPAHNVKRGRLEAWRLGSTFD